MAAAQGGDGQLPGARYDLSVDFFPLVNGKGELVDRE